MCADLGVMDVLVGGTLSNIRTELDVLLVKDGLPLLLADAFLVEAATSVELASFSSSSSSFSLSFSSYNHKFGMS